MITRREIKALVRETGLPKDEETLAVWFRSLYGRDFDCNEDGFHTGKDTEANHTLASAVKQALRTV